ncbi:MAG: group 1 truncated hemoglobin [Deltaproteobacteria bacterium]|nr:MAG: group 1 truncated hemoglobin [Deltaproteobacteria bacterium]TNF31383.1 MAG: group 1 truncated hemoglobin [Deltaproteobacteria bacterium]
MEPMYEGKLSFEELGGRDALERVAKKFYDLIYEHPWIGLFFKDIDQKVIESQQVDFMSAALGGPRVYLGKLPVPGHKHMMLTDELFDLREELLVQAMNEVGIKDELRERWLRIDEAFRKKLVKRDISECEKRFNTDEILDFPNPNPKINKAA